LASIIDRAVKALTALGVAHTAEGDQIRVPPADDHGFEVRLHLRGERAFLVECEGWRHDFDRAEDAYDCFEYVLSDSARLKIVSRGARPELWQIEKREFGMWVPGHPVRRRSWAFWQPRRTEYRHNRVFRAASSPPGQP
jgi:hypothetical protein